MIEYPLVDELDVNGWDIKKALKLYRKSNPPLYEWLISPIVYLEQGDFAQQLRALMPEYYSPTSSMYHYLHMARENYRQYLLSDTVRIKKYFYVLRPVFACMWIEKYRTQPPVEFLKLMEAVEVDDKVESEVRQLFDRKKAGEESDREKRIEIISSFLNRKIQYFEQKAKNMKAAHTSNERIAQLDEMFRGVLKI